jgi:spermidine dehydrogenase
MTKPKDHTGDDALGLSTPIDRRDILNSTLLAAGSILLGAANPLELLGQEDWTGFGGVGDYAHCNGNTWDVVAAGHNIRDHTFDKKPVQPVDTSETFDCVIVGGGISGLAAALFYQRETKGKSKSLILENHPVFGGEAKRNEFIVDGHRLMIHQGSAACFPPLKGSFLETFYQSIGIDWNQFHYQEWSGPKPAMKIETAPYPVGGSTSGFFFGEKFGRPKGSWLIDPWGKRLAGAPISERAKRELLSMKDTDRKPFSQHRYQPKVHGDDASRHLDSLTIEQHLGEKYGLHPETVRTYLSPITGGGSGLGADVLSAYAEYAADVLLPWDYGKGVQMFPGGNTGIARHIVKTVIPDVLPGPSDMPSICQAKLNLEALDRQGQASRIRLGATVISVKHLGDPKHADQIEILYAKQGKLYRLMARSVILAGGSWTTQHIAKDMPENCREAYAQFYRSPCLMANVAVRNWRFLYDLGLTECQWFEGFGNYITMRKVAKLGTDPTEINPDMPTVLNLKILFSHPGLPIREQVMRGRAELFSTPYRDYERRIREQLTMMFGSSGFNAKRDIAGIILNRWGHAYLSPQPGFFFGQGGKPAPGEVLRQSSYGRIAFGNSDLSGVMDHRMSILESQRAVQQILKA